MSHPQKAFFRSTENRKGTAHLRKISLATAALAMVAGCGPKEGELTGEARQGLVAAEPEDFAIAVPGSLQCMQVKGNSLQGGAAIEQGACAYDANQLWRFTPVTSDGEAIYQITSRSSGLALDVPGFSAEANRLIQQWTPNGGTNQQFRAVDAGGGLFRLEALHSGQCLTVLRSDCLPGGICRLPPPPFCRIGAPCPAEEPRNVFAQAPCSATDWRQKLRIERKGALAKKALVVLMQNGGYRDGLPFDDAFDLPIGLHFECRGWGVDLGLDATVDDAIRAIRNAFRLPPLACLSPGGWSVSQRTKSYRPTDWLREVSGFVPEEAAEAMIRGLATNRYSTVRVLQGGDFNLTRARQELKSLALSHAIDLHVLAHGNAQAFGVNEEFTAGSIRGLRNIVGLTLRTVFQQNCTGSGLNGAWRDAGAGVVTGTAGINSMPTAYAPFLRLWVQDNTFSDAVRKSYDEVAPIYCDGYRFIDQYDEAAAQPRNPPQIDPLGRLSCADEREGSSQVIEGDGSVKL